MKKNENTTVKTNVSSNQGLHHNGLHYLREKERVRKQEERKD